MVFYAQGLILLILLIISLPLLVLEIPVIFSMIPQKFNKALCFFPCGLVGAITIQSLLVGNIGLFIALSLVFCFTLYGGFAIKDIFF